jgi:hypothetical protein
LGRSPRGVVDCRAMRSWARGTCISLGFALGMTLLPGLARAGDQADQRFAEGMTFVQQGRYEEARQAFLQAYALHATQPVLWNLAVSELSTCAGPQRTRSMCRLHRACSTR